MARGSFVPKILSPSEAETQLALPCWMILIGIAEPVFPNRDRGTPSPMVLIVGTKGGSLLRYGITSSPLPVPVEWRQWRTSVVPVLNDERWRSRSSLLSASMNVGSVNEIIEQIGKSLFASFVEGGWGPDLV